MYGKEFTRRAPSRYCTDGSREGFPLTYVRGIRRCTRTELLLSPAHMPMSPEKRQKKTDLSNHDIRPKHVWRTKPITGPRPHARSRSGLRREYQEFLFACFVSLLVQVPLTPDGEPLNGSSTVATTIPLGAGFDFIEGTFNGNGIVVSLPC